MKITLSGIGSKTLLAVTSVKFRLLAILGAIGGAITMALGGWDESIITLLIFMGIDLATGVICAVMKKSKKSKSGGLKSKSFTNGIWKKGASLLLIIVTVRLDILIGTDYIRDWAVIALALGELLSIVENLGLIGVPIPKIVAKALDVLQSDEKYQSVDAEEVINNENDDLEDSKRVS